MNGSTPLKLLLGQPDSSDVGQLFTAYELDDDSLRSVDLFGKATIEEVMGRYPWLATCQKISTAQNFFHWELEFAPLFARGLSPTNRESAVVRALVG